VRQRLALILFLIAQAQLAAAWPVDLVQALMNDARRLVPRSLGRLMLDREKQIMEETQRFPPEIAQIMAADLSAGRLSPETIAALDQHVGQSVALIKQHRVSEGIVSLGATLRIAADLSDPVLAAGPDGYPPGVVREYYAFIQSNLDKIPVVLDDPPALKLDRKALPGYWQSLLARSRAQAPVIREDLFRDGRLVNHTRIDFRSHVYGVASLSYSRAVTGIAATWLALWQQMRGDPTRQPEPVVVVPRDAPPLDHPLGLPPGAEPPPSPPMEARRP
jgi:hypothetical protein